MKKIFTTLIAVICTMMAFAYDVEINSINDNLNDESLLTINVETPGTLSDIIFNMGQRPALVSRLKVIGTLNDDDFTCMRETMTSLVYIDLSEITNTSGVNFKKKESLIEIILPNNLTSIESQAFFHCYALTSITIPNKVTSIGDYAFNNCKAFTSISIPNSITSIGQRAFSGCRSIFSITLSHNITTIGSDAFIHCSALDTIICLGSTPPNVEGSIGANTSTCVLVVPNDAYTNYLRHACWGQFLNILNTKVTILSNNDEWGTSIGAGYYTENDNATLIAIPNLGYHFIQWSDGNTENPRTITVTEDITLTAEFAINQYEVVVESDTNGTVTGAGTYDYGTEVTIEAIANEGYHFVQWSDGNTENPRTFTIIDSIPENINLTAEFAINQYQVTLDSDGNGSVTGAGTYDYGTEVTIEAIANDGYRFVLWSDGNRENPRMIVVTEDIELSAKFELDGTPVDNITNSNVIIYTNGYTLHIEGAETDYYVLDAAGRLIYSGRDTEIQLPRGVYMINVGGKVQKVVI